MMAKETSRDTENDRVNPAARTDDSAGDEGIDSHNEQGVSAGDRQRAQNQDQNTHYDPSEGKRPDQRRRNDKQGRMGG